MSEYIIKDGCISPSDELMHYGVLGMKWGVRRYQNSDGSLTEAGRKRYGYGELGSDERLKLKQYKKLNAQAAARATAKASTIGAVGGAALGFAAGGPVGALLSSVASSALSAVATATLNAGINAVQNSKYKKMLVSDLKKRTTDEDLKNTEKYAKDKAKLDKQEAKSESKVKVENQETKTSISKLESEAKANIERSNKTIDSFKKSGYKLDPDLGGDFLSKKTGGVRIDAQIDDDGFREKTASNAKSIESKAPQIKSDFSKALEDAGYGNLSSKTPSIYVSDTMAEIGVTGPDGHYYSTYINPSTGKIDKKDHAKVLDKQYKKAKKSGDSEAIKAALSAKNGWAGKDTFTSEQKSSKMKNAKENGKYDLTFLEFVQNKAFENMPEAEYKKKYGKSADSVRLQAYQEYLNNPEEFIQKKREKYDDF